jgi:BirA family biotin operon repressor/biotin-[acetyl-CoA-carboxylase] ligase
LQALYRYQEIHPFIIDGRTVSGQIVGVEEDGRLAVAIGNELRRFGLQEIRHA